MTTADTNSIRRAALAFAVGAAGTDVDTTAAPLRRGGATTTLLAGGVCGLAWAAGLRGAMAELAGAESTVSWSGTFVWILLPGVAVGALLGWAEHLRRTGGRRGWRWLALSPLLFASVLFSDPTDLLQFFRDGIGGGALAVPLFGMLGGYALSTRGPLWARLAGRAVVLSPIAAGAVAVLIGVPVTAHGTWLGLYFYSFCLVLAMACTIPHRPVSARRPGLAG
jgi:hypothetical protein